MSLCECIDFRRGGNLAVPDLTEYVAATSAGGSRAGLSRPSLVRHRASLFISTRMPPENLLRVFIFVVKNKWTIWGRFHFYTNGPFWVKCQNGGFGAILLVSGMVPADAGPGWSAADRHEPAGHAPVLFCISDIWGGLLFVSICWGRCNIILNTPTCCELGL